jgi:hypothetical protein
MEELSIGWNTSPKSNIGNCDAVIAKHLRLFSVLGFGTAVVLMAQTEHTSLRSPGLGS